MEIKKKIAVVAGIRSQYIKMASFQRAVNSLSVRDRFIFVDAAQHYSKSLSGQYLNEYGLEFDYSLREKNLPESSEARFATIEYHLKDYFENIDFDKIVVFGDANTTLAAALAAKRSKRFLIHVEAGVRTGDSSIEETNRRVTDFLSDFRIASCRKDHSNLIQEGHSKSSEYIGDIVRDLCNAKCTSVKSFQESIVVITLHHNSDWPDQFLKSVFGYLGTLPKTFYFFSHPRMFDEAIDYSNNFSNIIVTKSVTHEKILEYINKSEYVITDSGALQRESYYMGKHVLVVQESPFWKTFIECGSNIFCRPDIFELKKNIEKMEILKNLETPFIDDFGTPPIGNKIVGKILAL